MCVSCVGRGGMPRMARVCGQCIRDEVVNLQGEKSGRAAGEDES